MTRIFLCTLWLPYLFRYCPLVVKTLMSPRKSVLLSKVTRGTAIRSLTLDFSW